MLPELVVLLPIAVLATAYATLFIVEVIDEWRYRRMIHRELQVDDEDMEEIYYQMPELWDYPTETIRRWFDEADAWIDAINSTTKQ